MKRLLLVLAFLPVACATPRAQLREPTLAEWQAADFGSAPVYYNSAIQNYLVDRGGNINGTTFRYTGEPKKVWVGDAPNFKYGYGVCVELSERTVDMDHTTFGPTFFFLMNGTVSEMHENAEAKRFCNRVGRVPSGQAIRPEEIER